MLFFISEQEFTQPHLYEDIHRKRCICIKEMLQCGADPNFVCYKSKREICTVLTKITHSHYRFHSTNTAHNTRCLEKCWDMFRLLCKYGIDSLHIRSHVGSSHPIRRAITWFVDTPYTNSDNTQKDTFTKVVVKDKKYRVKHKYDKYELGICTWSEFHALLKPYKGKICHSGVWDSVELHLLPRKSEDERLQEYQRNRLRDILRLGGNPNADSDDNSLLDFATAKGDFTTVKLLMAFGGNPTICDGYSSQNAIDVSLGLFTWLKNPCYPHIFHYFMQRYPNVKHIRSLHTKKDCKYTIFTEEARQTIAQWIKNHPREIYKLPPRFQARVQTWIYDL